MQTTETERRFLREITAAGMSVAGIRRYRGHLTAEVAETEGQATVRIYVEPPHTPVMLDERPCPSCFLRAGVHEGGRLEPDRVNAPDPCFGHLGGVLAACCGHGIERAYVTHASGETVRDDDALAHQSQGGRAASFPAGPVGDATPPG